MTFIQKVGHTVLALSLFVTASTTLHAQAPDLSHTVRFDVGDTNFLDGDSITIDSIQGPTDTVLPGNLYLVTGTYKLGSHPSAVLSSNLTTKGPSGPTSNRDAPSEPRNMPVQQGQGHFSVYLHMDTEGYPHISFYPTGGGSSFASIYFGTDATLLHKHSKVIDTVSR